MKIDIVIPTTEVRKAYLLECLESIIHGSYLKIRLIVVVDTESKLPFKIWNEHLKTMTADGMVYIANDVKFYVDTLKIAVENMKKRFADTDGLIGFNQFNLPDFCKSAMGLIGAKFADRFIDRQVFCPDYIGLHGDAELGDYAESVKKFYFCEEAKIFHYHLTEEVHTALLKTVEDDKRIRAERKKYGLLWGKNFKRISEVSKWR